MAEMTRPRAQTGAGAQAAGYGHQRRTPSIASEISLAAVVTAIGCARAYVTSIVTAWGLECLRDDAVLLTSELVTNAVRATGITGLVPRWSDPDHLALIRLRLTVVDDSLVIEVWDRETTPPVLPDTPDPEDESGRGLLIVAGLSKQWLAASFQINHRRFGGATAHQAPEPVPSLARLFSRPPSSVLAKMANLDGSRSHGGKWDILAGAMLRDDPAHFTHAYRVLLSAARAEGIGEDRLPDFLGLEYGGQLDLLGQDELETSTLEAAFKEQIAQRASEGV